MNLPFEIDLNGKVAVITGAGGVLCSDFARAIAKCGAKVALLDINVDAAEKYAEETRQAVGRMYVGVFAAGSSSIATTTIRLYVI